MNHFQFRKSIIMILSVVMVMSVMLSCATIEKYVAKPETNAQRLAYVKTVIADLNNSVVDLMNANVIDLDQTRLYRQKAVQVKLVIDMAESAFQFKDIEAGEKNLEVAEQMTKDLEAFVKSFTE
jgi:hypothetical protein